MENSAYVPSSGHMSSPALVVLPQTAAGLQDALRIQSPFNHQFQISEAAKELHRPFTASAFGLRHMESYCGLPAHILTHLQPQFLHPGLQLGSGGAFRPLADLKAFPSPPPVAVSAASAFTAPKCLKVETGSDHSHGHHGHSLFSPGAGEDRERDRERLLGPSPRTTDSCSPASASMSPQPTAAVKEELLDAQMAEDSDQQPASIEQESSGVHEEPRGFRIGSIFGAGFGGTYTFTVPGLPSAAHSLNKAAFLFDHDTNHHKKKKDPSSCPVCGLTISAEDLETHFMHELERLYKINGSGAVANKRRKAEMGRPSALPGDSGPEGRWETFQRIKTNRQGRLRLKIRKRKLDDGCPICIGKLQRSQDEISMHLEQCRKGVQDEEETVDIEGDIELEEWTESRSRMQTLISSAPTSTEAVIISEEMEGDDLIVDGDEPEDSPFGPSQYTNADSLAKSSNRDKYKDKESQSQVATVNSSGDVVVGKGEAGGGGGGGLQCDSNVSTSDAEPSSRAQMIEELRSRIRQLEAEGPTGSETATTTTEAEDYKCLICLEHYKKPVISTVCWHVHCEECWLHTLGSKKVCPQCSMITSPSDLRRIFM